MSCMITAVKTKETTMTTAEQPDAYGFHMIGRIEEHKDNRRNDGGTRYNREWERIGGTLQKKNGPD
ncbi:hypothetical protein PRIPAC_90145 [Pristionchus pacificus]|uniref:Uncharacterized protein n=1 Tax=Pristionchus pacificus TaxID=54126 RepID=A0A454XSP0_PRIPA|nr:hypothetical protein PRIPAC_90145 [Pristionchus pacificus]|eukprot:PDM81446.1 hypothetical protein PRIPAC_35322 [Pristionchus pacificus]